MDRRNFLKTGALTLGAAAFATETIFVAGKETDAFAAGKAVEVKVPSEGYVKEPSRRIPLIATADVAVVGGGPAGVAAAVSAARSGASVILLEKNWFLGGLWTGGLVLPVIDHEGAAPDHPYRFRNGGLRAPQGNGHDSAQRSASHSGSRSNEICPGPLHSRVRGQDAL